MSSQGNLYRRNGTVDGNGTVDETTVDETGDRASRRNGRATRHNKYASIKVVA